MIDNIVRALFRRLYGMGSLLLLRRLLYLGIVVVGCRWPRHGHCQSGSEKQTPHDFDANHMLKQINAAVSLYPKLAALFEKIEPNSYWGMVPELTAF